MASYTVDVELQVAMLVELLLPRLGGYHLGRESILTGHIIIFSKSSTIWLRRKRTRISQMFYKISARMTRAPAPMLLRTLSWTRPAAPVNGAGLTLPPAPG